MDEKEVKQFVEEQRKIVEQIRQKQETFEKGSCTQAELKEFETKANAKYDEISKKLDDMKKISDRLDELETKIKRPGNAPDNKGEKSVETKVFEKWLRFGERSLSPDEQKALRVPEQKVLTISGDTGVSYLAPGDYVQMIIKGVTEISPIRSLADVRPTSNDYVEIPKRTGQFSATWVAEIGSRSETTGLTYGMERIPNHEMYALVKVSKRSLEDSAFNLEAELTAEFAEQFAKAEGTAFVTGNAVGKPEGFTVNANVDITSVVYDVSDAKALTDGIIGLMFKIKTAHAQAASFLANRTMITALRKAKTTYETYIWEPDYQTGTPGKLLGAPLVEVPDLANPADGAKCMAFGNFRRGYVISDRVQIEIQRLVELYAESGQVGFLARKRVGGQVVLAEAIAIGVGQA